MKHSDKQIIQWLQSDDQVNKGMRTLMNTYQERLYSQIHRIVKTHEETDDVLQNTFVKIYRNIRSFKGKSSLYTWIYRIATNEALTIAKKNQVIRTVDIDDQVGLHNRSESHGLSSEGITKLLDAALSKLPEKQRAVFEMRYFDELTYKEISQLSKTSVGALKASYHHAVKKIENYITSMNMNYGPI